MVKITLSADCGNSPKRELPKAINIAFAKGDSTFLTENVTDQMVWNIIGDRKVEGKVKFSEELERMTAEKASELILERVLTHGNESAASGIMKMQDGRSYAFLDFDEFSGEKGGEINSITSNLERPSLYNLA